MQAQNNFATDNSSYLAAVFIISSVSRLLGRGSSVQLTTTCNVCVCVSECVCV